jgi:hypothetical protein
MIHDGGGHRSFATTVAQREHRRRLGSYPHGGGGDHAGPMHADGNERLRQRLFFYLCGGNDHIFPATLELPAATSNSTMEVQFPGSRRWRGESPSP